MVERQLCLAPEADTMDLVQTSVEEAMEEARVPFQVAMKIHIVVDEIYSNIIRCSRASEARVTCRIDEKSVWLEFLDDGIPFNPLETEEPDIRKDPMEREMGGLGILICRKIMDEISYQYEGKRNKLVLVKEV